MSTTKDIETIRDALLELRGAAILLGSAEKIREHTDRNDEAFPALDRLAASQARNQEDALLYRAGWSAGVNDDGVLVRNVRGNYFSERAAVLRRLKA